MKLNSVTRSSNEAGKDKLPTNKNIRLAFAFIFLTSILSSCVFHSNSGSHDKITVVKKSSENLPKRRETRKSNPPDNFKETPFKETNPEPVPNEFENKIGFILFKRSILDTVYPNSKPLPQEKLLRLKGFAAQGEFEPIPFSIYPLRKLDNLKVRVSALKNKGGEIISKENIDIWLLTYANIKYPSPSSKTWRRSPELLENITVNSAPAKECQRYWIRIKAPENAKASIYSGNVNVSHDSFENAISIPIKFRILPFKLIKDPQKHYSAYNYNLEREIDNRSRKIRKKAKKKGSEWIFKAAKNEYKTMHDYGLDTSPTVLLDYDKKKKEYYVVNGDKQIKNILDSGLKGPIPTIVLGMPTLYKQYTGEKTGKHYLMQKLPPDSFYKQLTKMVKQFEKKRKEKGWPEFIYVPIDEVAGSSKEFGANVYKAFKKAGVRTYATKNPKSTDASEYAPYVDFWCSGPFSMSYDKATSSKKRYWSYPNHIANENRHRGVRTKGGRMTYGYGHWRSGYTMLIPWIWRSYHTDHFHRAAVCGNQFDKNGNIMPAVYWECFREGIDDAKYIYTLQTAITQRKGEANSACKKAVKNAEQFLQDIWDSINVQERYLNKNMWPSEEFEAIRWRIANSIMELYQYPPHNHKLPPSVIVDTSKIKKDKTIASFLKEQEKLGNTKKLVLNDKDFSAFKSVTKEGKIKVVSKNKHNGEKSLLFDISIDHKNDKGGEKGYYPMGWPRIIFHLPNEGINLRNYDYLYLWIMVDSARDKKSNNFSPFRLKLLSKKTKFYQNLIINEIEEKVWRQIIIPTSDIINKTADKALCEQISGIELGIAESWYQHGENIKFYIDDIALIKLKKPLINSVTAPRNLSLPQQNILCTFDLMGIPKTETKKYVISASIKNNRQKIVAKTSQTTDKTTPLPLDVNKIIPGKYVLNFVLKDMEGKEYDSRELPLTAFPGAFYSKDH